MVDEKETRTRRIGVTDAVLYRGEPFRVHKAVGGGDFIITNAEGARIAVNVKDLTLSEAVEVVDRTEPDNDGDAPMELEELKAAVTALDSEAPVGAMDRPTLEAKLAELKAKTEESGEAEQGSSEGSGEGSSESGDQS